MTLECDVLVIGGGPAGSSAARAAAKNGAKTILIEEDNEIGKPVQCAEGVGKYLVPFLPFQIPPNLIKWEIKGMTFWANDILIKRNGGPWAGYTIDRTEWDQWLASLAIKEGAKIKTNSKLIDLDFTNEYIVKKAIVKSNKKKIEINPKIIIAADGVKSAVVDILKIKKNIKNAYGEVNSYEIKNVNLKYPKYDQLFLGDFAPGGYAYIFPISNNRANIGVGKTCDSPKNMDNLYEKFLELPIIKEQIGKGLSLEDKNGYAPLKYLTKDWIYGNVILAGDSANQNFKPFIEGNIPGIICGDIAGKISAKGLKDLEYLNKYKKSIYKRLGPMFKSSDSVFDLLLKSEGLKNVDLLYLIIFSNLYSLKKLEKYIKADEKELIKLINSWKNSKIKQSKTKLVEEFYLLILSIMRYTRRA
jgi:digeranylgeranylglycerophospholipid reductase